MAGSKDYYELLGVDKSVTDDELKKVCQFCERMGLDYGEVDILRDNTDGRIYIVDANNTPAGPPSPIDDKEWRTAIVRLAHAFDQAFEV